MPIVIFFLLDVFMRIVVVFACSFDVKYFVFLILFMLFFAFYTYKKHLSESSLLNAFMLFIFFAFYAYKKHLSEGCLFNVFMLFMLFILFILFMLFILFVFLIFLILFMLVKLPLITSFTILLLSYIETLFSTVSHFLAHSCWSVDCIN